MAGISPSTYSGPYTANGSQTAFPFDFTAGSSSEVAVEVNGATVSSALYTVAIASDFNGGTVTFLTAPANASLVKPFANPDFLQSSEFENEGAYKLATVNTINRRGAVRDLWLRAQTALLSPAGFATAANRAGKILGWGGGGDPVFLSGTGADSALRTDLAASGGSALAGFLQVGTGAVARSGQSKLRDTVSVKDFGAVGDGVVDDTAAIVAALTALESGQYEAARGLFLPGGIYRTTATISLTVANVPFKIYSDTRATIFPDMADGAWTFDIDFATGATANFLTFDMENITINDTTSPQQVKNGIRMQRVIGSKFTRCEFNNLNVAVDMGNDSNCNTFDTCMWRGNIKGWKSTAGVANNNVFQNCQWRYHTGTAFDSTGTDGNIIRGGDFEPGNASPVVIASSLRMEAVRFERNVANGTAGITVLSDNRLDVTAYSDGSTQVLPLYDIQGSNNECTAKTGSGAQVAIVKAGAKRNVTTIGYFDQLVSPGGALYSCVDAEPTNVLNVGGSFQASGKIAISEAFKDQLVPADLTTWTATNCTVADLGSGGYRVTITGASPSLSYTPAAGSYSNINVAVTATSSVAASQPIMHITGGTDPSFALSNGWPANVAARKVLATMAGNTFTNPVFTIVPTTPTNATTYDIYNLRSAQTYAPQ